MQGREGGLLLLLLGELVLCSPDGTGCTLYKGIEGEDFTLTPNVRGTPSEIIWKKEVNQKFDKVAEWDGSLNLFTQWLNRSEIDPGSGSLTIQKISQKIDNGTYKAEVLVGESYQLTYACLKVLEPPSAPNLTCSIDGDGIHVNCMSVTRYELSVSYHWNYSNMNDISQSNSTELLSSIKLPKNTDLSKNITCTIVASNSAVSNSISLMTCDSRGFPAQERVRTGIVFGALFVGLTVGLVIWWIRKDRPKSHPDETVPFREEDPENVTVQTSRREDHPKSHPYETVPLREEGPENATEQTSKREEVPHDDENMPSQGLMSELENKKTSSSEEDPEIHTDEGKPSHELTSEAENKKTSNNEDSTTSES